MQDEKPGKYVLFILNYLTTVLRILWCIFLLGILFIAIVSLISGTESELLLGLRWLFSPADHQRLLLLIVSLVFLAFTILLWLIRRFSRNWIAHFSKPGDGEKYLLTWKNLRENRRAILKGSWGLLQIIWAGLLVIAIPIVTYKVEHNELDTVILPISGSSLGQRLALSAIVTFVFLSLIVRYFARSQPKEENTISVKELELVYQSLDAVSKELQQLQELSERIVQRSDEQFIKDLTEKIMKPFQQSLNDEKEALLHLEEEVQQLKQQTNALSSSAAPDTIIDTQITQKLNRIS